MLPVGGQAESNYISVDIQDFSFRVLFRLKSDVLSGQLVASLAAWLKAKARVKVHTMESVLSSILIKSTS